MKRFFTSVLLLTIITFGNLAAAQSEFDQLVEDVKRVSENPHADRSEVDRLNEKIKKLEIKEEAWAKDFQADTLTELIKKIAKQIDEQMLMGNFARICIPEFAVGENRTFDPACGALPRHIAESLRHELAEKVQSHRGYSILSEEALQKTLKDKGITPEDLRTGKTKNLQNLVDGKDISLIVDGYLKRVNEAGIILQVNLIDTKEGRKLDHPIGGKALLNSNELAMCGISKFSICSPLPGEPLRYQLEPGIGLVSKRQMARVQSTRGAVVEAHPLDNPQRNNPNASGTFDVWIETRTANTRNAYRKLPSDRIRFNGNDCYVGLSKGEEFQIIFKAESSEDIFVRVLVDGLNSLSQHQKVIPMMGTRGAYVEAVASDSEGELVVAPRVSLEEARPWVVPRGSKNLFAVPGFFDVSGRNDTVRRFRIVDADESAAARKNYTEQIGLITIAFYKGKTGVSTPSTRGAVGTGMGNTETTKVDRYMGDKVPGEMIAVYNIRYMTPETLRQMAR